MSHVRIKNIDCYGEMHEGQNIEVVCNDEFDDGILPRGFKTWSQAVNYLTENWNGDIVQLQAI